MFDRLSKILGRARQPHALPERRASFLPRFEQDFAPRLGARGEGFRTIFTQLEARADQTGQPLLIVETGGMREAGDWAGDGQSTVLWSAFAGVRDCELHSVGSAPRTAAVIRQACGVAVRARTGDGAAFLHEFARVPRARQIDLLYLDSGEFEPDNPFPLAMQCVHELIAARPCLHRGSIVAIDDNVLLPDGELTGRGYLAMQWFRHLDIPFLHRGSQFIWQL